jgi:hypothetical protein
MPVVGLDELHEQASLPWLGRGGNAARGKNSPLRVSCMSASAKLIPASPGCHMLAQRGSDHTIALFGTRHASFFRVLYFLFLKAKNKKKRKSHVRVGGRGSAHPGWGRTP